MNPFTRFLRSQQIPSNFDDFVGHWDALESLIVNIYRAGVADPTAEAAYQELRGWLNQHYPRWAADLEPFWREAKEAGGPPPTDPFVRLCQFTSAGAFVNNRPAMQALPAAREAINRYLLTRRPEL